MDRKIIIFGSGQFGYLALSFLGEENVACFCDNNASLVGTKKYGKQIISFEELRTNERNAVVLIAVDGHPAYEIAMQCEENGVRDYLNYLFLREHFSGFDRAEVLDFLRSPENRAEARKDIYLRRTEELERQVAYFKTHVDIRDMKPAKGELRERQLKCVQVSTEFFCKVKGLGIHPFLCGGNLIGYVRHGGFVPWDDDIDFTLIREEYERLKTYCREHMHMADEGTQGKSGNGKEIAPEMESWYVNIWHDHFNVVKVLDNGYGVGIDFFSLEYYADHYGLPELRRLYGCLRADMMTLDSEEERISYIEKAVVENRENTAKESGQLYFGIDNMEMKNRFHREHFIPRDVIFPLKKVIWEGGAFFVPNNAEEFLTYEYENPWEFPDDVGIPLHYKEIRENS